MSRRWLLVLVAAGVLSQGALSLARLVSSYKLLALGADAPGVGVVTAGYALLPLLVALPLARYSDRHPRLMPLLQVSVVVLALGCAVTAAASALAVVALGVVILGLGHLLFTLGGQAAVARWSRDEDLDLGFGWFTASYSIGQAVGPLLGGWLVGSGSVTDPGRAADVDLALWVGTAVAVLAVPLLVIPVGTPSLTRPAADGTVVGTRATVREVLAMPGVASHMVASLALLAAVDILVAFLPLVGEEAGVSPVVIGWLLAVRGATGILSRFLLPWLSARFLRAHLLIASVTGAGLALAVPPLMIDATLLAGLALAVGGFFLGMGQPLTMGLISTAVPTHWRSQALAIRLMGNRVGQVGFPLLAGAVAAPLGPGAAVWVMCLVLLGSGAEKSLRLRRT